MPSDTEIRASIKEALNGLATAPILDASRRVFETLGYKSERRPPLPDSKPTTFLENFDGQRSFNSERGMLGAWKSADFLCQVTDEEIQLARKNQPSLLADGKIEKGNARSFAFLSIGLNEDTYTRAQYSGITREINRMFNMPAICLFKNNGAVTLSVIDRRQHKKESAKDVLEKVTLIKDIEYKNPHRGHVDILSDLALPNLAEKFPPLENFDHLLRAWRETLDISTLNKRFYRELSNWYFWALPQVRFPTDLETNDEKLRATSLIRLLTRLIFCWFLKEKSLIPEKLFRAKDLANILKEFDPESAISSTYYLAILQNLFFATLNQRMGKDSNGKPYRVFAKDEGFQKNRSTYDVNNLYRYEALFKEDPDSALAHFVDIPFLNGGLFECLDRTEDGTDKKLYLDGFSRNPKKRPHVPDRLFFDSGEVADLSDVYDDKKRKAERVTGLINILDRYKFTIVENTPIDEEVALDPELLGKVFENLLASYNEETKTTARKQTGSFYTPRPIVDYMVDESLKAHLTKTLVEKARMDEAEARTKLNLLFVYTKKEHAFNHTEVGVLISAINSLKILDPACGSGAFPMGALHKLVYLLSKLDERNEKWRDIQVSRVQAAIEAADKIDDPNIRDSVITGLRRQIADIQAAFAENGLDYGRKLYLIENCLYGVDIQPIAIQITKLRFFISLICDQKTNSDKAKNLNIKPLPNLETKFVAANSLIGLPEMELDTLIDPRVGCIEKEIESLYHNYFSIQRRDQKLALQRKIRTLRQDLGKLLGESLMAPKKAQHLADWDPFDPQSSADFFDPHWMFGLSMAGGCDIVMGNPPYIKERESKHVFEAVTQSALGKRYHEGKMDYWFFFLHRALEITRPNGVIAYITSRYWINSTGSKKLINHIQECACLFHVVDIGALPVFEQVAGHHMLHFYKMEKPQSSCLVKRLENSLDDIALSASSDSLSISRQSPELLFNTYGEIRLYNSNIEVRSSLSVGDVYEVSQGVVQNPDKVSSVMSKRYGLKRGKGVFVLEKNEFESLKLNTKELSYVKLFYDESSVAPFHLKQSNAKHLFYMTKNNCPRLDGMPNIERHLAPFKKIMDARRETLNGTIEWFQLHWPRTPRFFEPEKVVLPSMFRTPSAAFVSEPAYFGLGSNVVIGGKGPFSLKVLCAILNSSFGKWWFIKNSKQRGVGVDVGVDRLRQFPLPDSPAPLRVVELLASLLVATLSENTQGQTNSSSFIIDLIDACVLESYFFEHMAERNLLFHALVEPHLAAYNSNASSAYNRDFLANLHQTLSAPNQTVCNRLDRITTGSPELLAVIKKEGIVEKKTSTVAEALKEDEPPPIQHSFL